MASEILSNYQLHVRGQREAKLKPSSVAAQWQADGRYEIREPQLSTPVSADAAVAELIAAVSSGKRMPWGMVGIKWEVAIKLLELLEVSDGEQS